ncbi:hypothetical protein A1O1_05010 [Capronia coronata CBS 617.96]|uniref:Major facilitator superfamily (MFS) profile domain-containing protein n=1 Tax=Capronia coronata CBS 617.96 TaxID=1182541 RepID=W9Y5H6_9EURO|nr:uncharacterized protein A1O1_05010 [Capronia coronata CBS 617.96]EXJ88082.1 hypothetical protein A1O1_05010 [Capronia coronata CBS 617.96]
MAAATLDDVTSVPGTTHLVDLQGTMDAPHEKHKDIVLVPAPSQDPEDPLNWTPRRKLLHMFCIFIYCLFVGMASAAVYSVLVPLSIDSGLSVADLNAGTGYMFLFFGLGCIVFQPLALQYGKRPVFIFSMLATLAIQVWSAYCTTNGQWIANKILQGFVGSPIESLCEISVADLYFTHERAKYMAMYAFSLTSSNILAPIFAGFIYDGQGYKWVLYWPAIGCGLGAIILFFLMEETNYDRAPVIDSTAHEPHGHADSTASAEAVGQETKLPVSTDTETEHGREVVSYHRKTYWDKLKLLDKPRPNLLLTMAARPFLFLSLPVVVYCGFGYGAAIMWSNLMTGTSSLVLSYPPYSFEADMVGLFSIASLLGVAVGCLCGGPISDWIALRLARRNGGILEAEHRLWIYVYPTVIFPAALILWGVGAAHHVHWFGLAVGSFLFSTGVAVTVITMVSYCIDTYKDLSSEAMVTIIVIRNSMAFGIGYAITPWVKLGYQDAFIIAAFMSMAACLVFLVMVVWGKQMRVKTAHLYRKFVKDGETLGLSHS